jgi:GntR family transcriptional regulator/GntR family frlABCD operon transcriptional regulator
MNKDFIYKQVYQDLKGSILSGQYKTGQKLPSENELKTIYKTTRVTIRQAFDELIREGFIYKEHGKGTFVKSETRSLGLLSFKGFSEVVGEEYNAHSKVIIQPQVRRFPTPFFYELSPTEVKYGCVYLERLRFADETPVMLEQTYLPNIEVISSPNNLSRIDSLTEDTLIGGSLFKTLHTKFSIEVIGLEQAIKAIESEKYTANFLKMKTKKPLLYIERRYLTSRSSFYIYSTLYCNTDKYAISSSF